MRRSLAGLLCFLNSAALPAADTVSSNLVTLPFELRRGHLMVPAHVNEIGPRHLMLDTGYTMTMLEPALARELNLRRAGQVTIVGIAGEEEASQFDGPTSSSKAWPGPRAAWRPFPPMAPRWPDAATACWARDFFAVS